MQSLSIEKLKTDVLVIGAGAGGMMAAISAADEGVDVTLCEKGNARRSGGITAGNDHFFCYIPEIHGKDVRKNFIHSMIAESLMDADIACRYIDLAYDVLRKWESWGVNLKTDGHYEFTGHGWPGSSGKMGEPGNTDREYIHFSDAELCPKLERQVRKRGVRIMNRVMMTELLKDHDGTIIGAIGISTREPILFVIGAKSVILNTGAVNGNRLYPSPYIKSYSMAEPGTGDGDIMAYNAGAALQNVEFCYRQTGLRFGPWAGRGTWVGVLRDADGKPIAPPYLSEPDPELGDSAVENPDAIDHAWASGKGPVWMDTRGISKENEKYMRWGFESEALQPFLHWVDRENIDFKTNRFEFTVFQPRTNIHIRINADFQTSVTGLYAIIRSGLSRSAVGGLVSGKAAALYAQDIEFPDTDASQDAIHETKQSYEDILNRKGTGYADWREAQWAVWQTMHCYALPPKRTENSLIAGYNQLLRLREKSHKILKARNQHDLYHCLEVLNLMDISELVLLAVNERKESRGQARRHDYPFVNPLLDKFLVVMKKQGKPIFKWESPKRRDLQVNN